VAFDPQLWIKVTSGKKGVETLGTPEAEVLKWITIIGYWTSVDRRSGPSAFVGSEFGEIGGRCIQNRQSPNSRRELA
jgi:hypothetical protein